MKESYGEGVASHTGPESCVVVREGKGEALTGAHAGRVLSRETLSTQECRRLTHERKATSLDAVEARHLRTPRGRRPHARMETPCTEAGRSRVRPGDESNQVRDVNPKGVRR